MAELAVKFCGWKIDHTPHLIIQLSTDSFACPGYDAYLGKVKQSE